MNKQFKILFMPITKAIKPQTILLIYYPRTYYYVTVFKPINMTQIKQPIDFMRADKMWIITVQLATFMNYLQII